MTNQQPGDDPDFLAIETQVERLFSRLRIEWTDRAAMPIVDIASPGEAQAHRALAQPGDPRPIAAVMADAEQIFARRVRMNHPRFVTIQPALRRISLARFNSRFSRSSALIRSRSSVVWPSRSPRSRSA